MSSETVVLSIVVPVYNEGNILETTLKEILKHASAVTDKYEILVVDDGSTDNTWDIVSCLSDKNPHIKGIQLSKNFGKETAILTGLEFSTGDAVIVMDGDLQHPPELIPRMVELWSRHNVEIVEAVKEEKEKRTWIAELLRRGFYFIMHALSGLSLERSSDFKLLDRKVVDMYKQFPERTRFFRGIISWMGFSTIELPFKVQDRAGGESSWNYRKLFKLAIHATTAFSTIPLYFVALLGGITLLISIIITIQTLYMKISGKAVSGFTTVIILILFTASVIMLSLGIIGMYIGRIFEEVKRRPLFIIKKTINLQ